MFSIIIYFLENNLITNEGCSILRHFTVPSFPIDYIYCCEGRYRKWALIGNMLIIVIRNNWSVRMYTIEPTMVDGM